MLWNCAPETYIILLTSVSQINSIKRKSKTKQNKKPNSLQRGELRLRLMLCDFPKVTQLLEPGFGSLIQSQSLLAVCSLGYSCLLLRCSQSNGVKTRGNRLMKNIALESEGQELDSQPHYSLVTGLSKLSLSLFVWEEEVISTSLARI